MDQIEVTPATEVVVFASQPLMDRIEVAHATQVIPAHQETPVEIKQVEITPAAPRKRPAPKREWDTFEREIFKNLSEVLSTVIKQEVRVAVDAFSKHMVVAPIVDAIESHFPHRCGSCKPCMDPLKSRKACDERDTCAITDADGNVCGAKVARMVGKDVKKRKVAEVAPVVVSVAPVTLVTVEPINTEAFEGVE